MRIVFLRFRCSGLVDIGLAVDALAIHLPPLVVSLFFYLRRAGVFLLLLWIRVNRDRLFFLRATRAHEGKCNERFVELVRICVDRNFLFFIFLFLRKWRKLIKNLRFFSNIII